MTTKKISQQTSSHAATDAQKTKRKKTGGRKKGTPNKATQLGRDTINNLLSSYSSSGLFSQDFLSLDSKERLIIAERLMSYIIPKYQAIALDITASSSTEKTLEERLKELSQ